MEGEKADQHCVVVKWSIENFTCWNTQTHGRIIFQENIRIEENAFHLELYRTDTPASDEYLVVRVYDKNLANNGELSITDAKGYLLWKKTNCNPTWKDCFFMEIQTDLIFKDVVKNIVQDPMFKDVITLRYTRKCSYNVVHLDHSKVDGLDRLLRIPSEILRNRSLTEEIKAKFYYNKDGRSIGYTCRFSSIQSTVDDIECSFELNVTHEDVSDIVHGYLYVLNSDNFSIMVKEIVIKIADRESWKFKYILPKDGIKSLFSLLIRLKIIHGKEYKNYECSSHDPKSVGISNILHISTEKDSKSVIEKPENAVYLLSKEFMVLYQDHDFSDFQLRCDSVTFPVHKNILSARSPVFKCMLASDMREAASGCLDIEDLDPHTLGRFLAFLYSGISTGEALQWEGALKLYYAADKYQVPSLKVECAAVLEEQVSVSNVCDLLFLADKHQDEMLKSAATDFISRNYGEVLESKEWESFMHKDPLLLCKTVTFLGRKSNMEKRCAFVPEM